MDEMSRNRWDIGQVAGLPTAGCDHLTPTGDRLLPIGTAQCGWPFGEQWTNRQFAARQSMWTKDRSRATTPSNMATARMPGVSMTAPPPGNGMRARYVVVCRPRPSTPRIDWVPMTVAPARALTSVDLPAPEVPSNPSVRPAATNGRSGSNPVPRAALTGYTVTPAVASAT